MNLWHQAKVPVGVQGGPKVSLHRKVYRMWVICTWTIIDSAIAQTLTLHLPLSLARAALLWVPCAAQITTISRLAVGVMSESVTKQDTHEKVHDQLSSFDSFRRIDDPKKVAASDDEISARRS